MYLLAFANTTNPLQRCNGLVVLAIANKSVVPRVHGWPGDCLFLALSNIPLTSPPSPKSATRAKYCAGKYYAESCLYHGSAGNETQSQESNPRPHCYQRMLLPLSHYIFPISPHLTRLRYHYCPLRPTGLPSSVDCYICDPRGIAKNSLPLPSPFTFFHCQIECMVDASPPSPLYHLMVVACRCRRAISRLPLCLIIVPLLTSPLVCCRC